MKLEISDLHVKYGNVEVLHGINLTVNQGEIVTILGANGAGKSTTLMSISGLVKPTSGKIVFDGADLAKMKSHRIVKMGVAQSPEGRRVFGTLTVAENLNMGAFTNPDPKHKAKTLEWIFHLFPVLSERQSQLAGTLSGGEQQMLAIGRALMANPKILLTPRDVPVGEVPGQHVCDRAAGARQEDEVRRQGSVPSAAIRAGHAGRRMGSRNREISIEAAEEVPQLLHRVPLHKRRGFFDRFGHHREELNAWLLKGSRQVLIGLAKHGER